MQSPRNEMGAPLELGKLLLGTSLPPWLEHKHHPQPGAARLGMGQHFWCSGVSLCSFPVWEYFLLLDRSIGIFSGLGSGSIFTAYKGWKSFHSICLCHPPGRPQGWLDAPDQVASGANPMSCLCPSKLLSKLDWGGSRNPLSTSLHCYKSRF